MNDETKAAVEDLRKLVSALRQNEPMRALLAHIDGEPARLAAAREAAIMEWRAGAADRDELRADCERRIAAAAAELRTLRARVAELERQREGLLMGGVTVEARQQLARAEKAEAQVAAARAVLVPVVERSSASLSAIAYVSAADVLRAMDEAAKR